MPFSKYIKYARSFNLSTCFQIGLIFCNRNLETFPVLFRPKQNLITALQTDIIYGYVVHKPTLPFSDGSYKETNQTLQALEIYQSEQPTEC